MSAADDLVVVFEGTYCRILMLVRVSRAYEKRLSVFDRARIQKTMQLYSEGNTSFPETLLKRECAEKIGDRKGSTVSVWAFKGRHGRVYGVFLTVDGRRAFVCSELDVKKTDRADRDCLKRAATNICQLVEEGAIIP